MQRLREDIIRLLREKELKITKTIIENIDIFNREELKQLYLIINQDDPEKLKELLIYQKNNSLNALDRIMELNKQALKLEKDYINQKETKEQKDLDKILELAF